MAKILGVDPGLTRCGYGLLDSDKATDFGLIQTARTEDPATRVGTITTQLEALLDR
ncbi:MAG: crossover junction endodeoxyribonuclease RuvC, partial [Aquiluna sp.]